MKQRPFSSGMMQALQIPLLTTRNHDRSAKVSLFSLPPGPTGAHPFRATKLSCHFGKPCLTLIYRLGSKAVRTGTSSANLLTAVASDLASSLTAEAGWKHRASISARSRRAPWRRTNVSFDTMTAMLFPLQATVAKSTTYLVAHHPIYCL
jgi:hypothetical protein